MLSEPCDTNFVTIFDGLEDLDEKRLATFCSTDKPAPIQGLSNSMLVKFYSRENYSPGFRASYRANTREPTIKGRVITKNTFRFFREFRVFTDI
ncbi:hypothetical protein BLA29_012592 [Euroglyphus maynei]|uniref:CUB domain-containing protein n=1 Tax=Euroglyphus maynei TaxID=6958 RepID=A0A1Y3AMB5_EURMA|nr:hypothetical protein BLA29_012592 [Euroglyphus maynei]